MASRAPVHTSVSPAIFQYTISEFAGTDGTAAGISSNLGNTAPTITAGTFTPANNDAGRWKPDLGSVQPGW